ncbi:mechanosensitive ion channel family protein [Castellaniella defragrans]|uniref:Mechanosensing system component YbdG n=1 Tax=Castellaniella defragrans TaxID=75697 RepID=A0A7W9TPZ0_CASDE|nr:mechanosensitive ion channel family protein [Castellaniella defragrans]KAB0612734.1 mechanosensitive ion channel family protein [Castellaniella defragrans]MBB6083652.1 miniconductance mechanosensitive channel [Castellaniella defragrans]
MPPTLDTARTPLEIWLDAWVLPWVPQEPWAQALVGTLALAGVVWLAGLLASRGLALALGRALQALGRDDWSRAVARRGVYRHLGHAVSLLLIAANIRLLSIGSRIEASLERLIQAVALIYVFLALTRLLRAWQDVNMLRVQQGRGRPIKGYLEIAQLAVWALCLVLVVSVLLDQSPLLMISGLGALSAVLLLVFKDTLLSLVASTQMNTNDMLRIGDWIEMPQAGADGFVIDMALHTVKVQNWDKTVTTIPTYKLFSESYRNWRQMFESGGRRIKRTLRIDAESVRFLDDAEILALRRYRLLGDYLAAKQSALDDANQALREAAEISANRRRLTNLGTFRAYALACLQRNPDIRQDMTMIVRMLEPDSQGIPVEVYCFSRLTAWVDYERVQGDLFDHLLAILPELSLRVYQAPSGHVFARLAGAAGGPRDAPAAPPPGNGGAGTPGD